MHCLSTPRTIDAADRERLLAEATDAFLLNLNLFNALGAR